MRSPVDVFRQILRIAHTYAVSGRASRDRRLDFESVQAYCFFIGYPRSGHSLIGSLLDAHSDAVIAHEFGAFQYVHAMYDRLRLFHLLAENAQAAAAHDRPSREFRYAVPGQWQGRFGHIRVIGDNKAEGATLRLRARPYLLPRLQRLAGVPLRAIHVVRNPFDCITTMATRAAERQAERTRRALTTPDLWKAVDRYIVLCGEVERLKRELSDAVYEVRHEDFVAQPAGELRKLCEWLGLEPEPEYLAACAGIVWPNPRHTRHRVEWPTDLRSMVEALIERTDHLRGYRFDE
jgi:hypothetical protein